MMYLLAIVLPPVAVLFAGRPFQALLNLILTCFFWLPGAIHAVLVVKDKKDDKRMEKQAKLIAKERAKYDQQ
ncbi:YqaE/Pmp3 family membrane protein [Bacillus sp. AK128]